MQPSEVVAEVTELIERPDLVSLGRSSFRNALHKCHNLAEFSRDLVHHIVPRDELNYQNGHAAIHLRELSSVVRRVIRIATLDSLGQQLDYNFKKLHAGDLTVKDYYGFAHRTTYSIIGNTLNLNGVSSNFDKVDLVYLSFPEISLDESGEQRTDSWILDVAPDLVVAALATFLAKIIQAADLHQALNEEFAVRASLLIQTYGSEILPVEE